MVSTVTFTLCVLLNSAACFFNSSSDWGTKWLKLSMVSARSWATAGGWRRARTPAMPAKPPAVACKNPRRFRLRCTAAGRFCVSICPFLLTNFYTFSCAARSLDRPLGEAGDIIVHRKDIDQHDRDRAHHRACHHGTPVENIAADQLGLHPS